uniref:Uncharacterized protein n=1 Tax=Physcomitrium patens TaxID=3218 RepID=A0A2K1IQX6_PHYPA|nr:hypothetical protein PHYPA_025789 [Physcomitrium patens]
MELHSARPCFQRHWNTKIYGKSCSRGLILGTANCTRLFIRLFFICAVWGFKHTTHPRFHLPFHFPSPSPAKPLQPCAVSSRPIARICANIHVVTSLCCMHAT